MNNDKVTLPEGDNLTFEQKYMDLVDTNNGDAYLTMGEGETTTVYWPVPEDYVEGNDVYIYHFSGVDRDYNTGDVEEISMNSLRSSLHWKRSMEINTSYLKLLVSHHLYWLTQTMKNKNQHNQVTLRNRQIYKNQPHQRKLQMQLQIQVHPIM